MRKKLLARTAVAVTLTTAGVVVPASSASAATNCFSNYICFFDGKGGTGAVWFTNAAGNACINLTAANINFNDKTSYISNNSGSDWIVYRNTGCSIGDVQAEVYPHSNGDMNSTWDNRISSFIRFSG